MIIEINRRFKSAKSFWKFAVRKIEEKGLPGDVAPSYEEFVNPSDKSVLRTDDCISVSNPLEWQEFVRGAWNLIMEYEEDCQCGYLFVNDYGFGVVKVGEA